MPLIICIEELNEIDIYSINLLNDILTENKKNGTFFIITTNKVHSIFILEQWSKAFEIILSPLSKQETDEWISLVFKNYDITKNIIAQLQEKSMGNPMYIEEWIKLVKHKLSANKNSLNNEQLPVPDSVKTIILSRIDSLSENARTLLQKASVIGNSFDIRVLEKMMLRLSHTTSIEKSFQELLFNSLIIQEEYNGISYRFYHNLIHTTVYDTILTTNKKILHAVAANTTENIFSDQLNNYYNMLANHYEIADINNKAMYYLQLEAEKCMNEFSNHRALQLYLRLLGKLLKDDNNMELIANVYLNISTMYCICNEINLAGIYLEKVKKIAEKLKSESLYLKISHLHRGTYYIRLLAGLHKQFKDNMYRNIEIAQ